MQAPSTAQISPSFLSTTAKKKHMLSPHLKDTLEKHIDNNLKKLQVVEKTAIDNYKKRLPLKDFLKVNNEDSDVFKERFLATAPNNEDMINGFLNDLLNKPTAYFLDHYGLDTLNELTTKPYE